MFATPMRRQLRIVDSREQATAITPYRSQLHLPAPAPDPEPAMDVMDGALGLNEERLVADGVDVGENRISEGTAPIRCEYVCAFIQFIHTIRSNVNISGHGSPHRLDIMPHGAAVAQSVEGPDGASSADPCGDNVGQDPPPSHPDKPPESGEAAVKTEVELSGPSNAQDASDLARVIEILERIGTPDDWLSALDGVKNASVVQYVSTCTLFSLFAWATCWLSDLFLLRGRCCYKQRNRHLLSMMRCSRA